MFFDFYKKTLKIVIITVVTVGTHFSSVNAYIPYDAGGTVAGNQSWPSALGLTFSMDASATLTERTVTHLGAFLGTNSDFSPGTTISVGIFRVSDQVLITNGGSAVTFSNGDQGTPMGAGGFNFKSISPVVLAADVQYAIVASGFNSIDRNGNTNGSGFGDWFTNSGGGIVNFNGYRWNDNANTGFKFTIDNIVEPAGNTDDYIRFAAGSFILAPEPETYLVLGSFLAALAFIAIRQKRKQKVQG